MITKYCNFCFSTNTLTKFISIVDSTLNKIYDEIDKKEYSFIDNISLEEGVLTINLKEDKTYVINIQKPNKQIWLSSPFSGPRRFEFNEANNKWIDIHNSNNSLLSLISKEINEEIIKRKYPSNSKLSLL